MTDRPLLRGLHLAALAGFAFSQPIFDLLRRFPTFLAAHQLSPADILSAAALIGAVLPAAFFLVGAATAMLGRPGRMLHLSAAGALLFLTVLPVAHRAGMPGPAATGIALVVAVGLVVAYRRVRFGRSVANLLALALPLFIVSFVADPTIRRLAFGTSAPTGASSAPQGDTPVVLLVFDELPLVSLLDAEREIDAERFPHFAGLASRSHWFRNASTVAAFTEHAIPALLTGAYPEGERVPHHAEYPRTLFTMLAPAYEMHVFEAATLMLPPDLAHSRPEGAVDPGSRGLASFFADLRLVWLHIVLPPDFTSGLPSVSDTWTDFGASPEPVEDSDRLEHEAQLEALRDGEPDSRIDPALAWIGNIPRYGSRTLHLLHVILPHNRWRHAPTGRHYCRKGLPIPGMEGDYWPEEDRYVQHSLQRHLVQVQMVDRMVGRTMETLEEAGILDESLLVVVADHGANFWPGEPFRHLEDNPHPQDILDVPLFVKLPGQTDGTIQDRHVQIIDVLPTIAEVLGMATPQGIDGHSLLDPGHPAPTVKRARDEEGSYMEFDADPDAKFVTLERLQSLWGSGANGSLHARREDQPLLGQSTPADVTVGAWTLDVDRNYFRNTSKRGVFVPAYVNGFVDGPLPDGALSVVGALDGRIAAIAPVIPLGPGRGEFHMLLPEAGFPVGPVQIDLLLMERTADGPRYFDGGFATVRYPVRPLHAGYLDH